MSNSRVEGIRDTIFGSNKFFDSSDVVQVYYEMIRRHEVDNIPIDQVTAAFGVSKEKFSKVQSAIRAAGMAGLLPFSKCFERRKSVIIEATVRVNDIGDEDSESANDQSVGAIDIMRNVMLPE